MSDYNVDLNYRSDLNEQNDPNDHKEQQEKITIFSGDTRISNLVN